MRDLYKIFDALEKREIPFCFQCQGKHGYYNLSVNDPRGKSSSISHKTIDDVEKSLKIMWGHLLAPQPISSLPRPTGMPRPA